MENIRNKPAPRRLPLAVYLAFLLVAALAFTGASAASYKTEASGSDSARVARFVVAAKPIVGQSESLTLDSENKSATYKFTVSNNEDGKVNETATQYDVVVTLPQALPNGVSLTLKKDNKEVSHTTADNTKYTFKDVGTFPAGTEQTDNLTLTFTALDSAESGTISGIGIEVNARQVD